MKFLKLTDALVLSACDVVVTVPQGADEPRFINAVERMRQDIQAFEVGEHNLQAAALKFQDEEDTPLLQTGVGGDYVKKYDNIEGKIVQRKE